MVAYEGHSGTTAAVFTVDLACAYGYAVSVDYLTHDGTALAGEDYLETSGGLAFPVGATTRTLSVPILADTEDEPHETFFVELSNLSAAGDPVFLDPLGVGNIHNDDFCPRSHGYWKNHPEEWPVDWLVLGGVEYDAVELLAFLNYRGSDTSSQLALQLVATKFNLLKGSDPYILPVVEAADAFLELYPPWQRSSWSGPGRG